MPRPHRHTRRVWLRGTGLLPERWRASAVLAPIFLFVFGHPSIPLLAVPRPPPVVIPTSTTPLPPPLVAILDPVCVAATQLLRPPYLDTLACFPGRSPPLRLHIIRKLGPVSRQLILLNPGRFQGCHALSLVGCLCLALHSILVGGFPPSPPPPEGQRTETNIPLLAGTSALGTSLARFPFAWAAVDECETDIISHSGRLRHRPAAPRHCRRAPWPLDRQPSVVFPVPAAQCRGPSTVPFPPRAHPLSVCLPSPPHEATSIQLPDSDSECG